MQDVQLRKYALRSLLSILIFVISYLLLIILTFGLIVALGALAFIIVSIAANIWTGIISIGVVSIGIIVLIFLIKFIFSVNKIDRSQMIEIKSEDELELFTFIHSVAKAVDTKKPKRVYLSSDINASVFYDSSFWSMFLPIRKNLVIGLGLVNSSTVDEIKAVLAHEFGHFSQKSMKVGSYVYNVNNVIFNALNNDDAFERNLQGWASWNWATHFAAQIGVAIIVGIKKILAQLYKIVNLPYMKLSRQMEFHADAIAANLVGSKPLIDSLCRMELSQVSLNETFSIYQSAIRDNINTNNIYENHIMVLLDKAKEFEVPIESNLPLVSLNKLNEFNLKRLNIEDQWASHPTISQRAEHLKSYKSGENNDVRSAWVLFQKASYYKEEFTKKIFAEVVYSGTAQNITNEEFIERYELHKKQNELSPIYNDIYLYTTIDKIDLNNTDKIAEKKTQDIFTEEFKSKFKQQNELVSEIETLQYVINQDVSVKTFDYEGEKYSYKDAPALQEVLKNELNDLKEDLKKFHQKVFQYFYKKAEKQQLQTELIKRYEDYFEAFDHLSTDQELFIEFSEKAQFFSYQLQPEDIIKNQRELRVIENKMRTRLLALLDNNAILTDIENQTIDKTKEYAGNEIVYFENERYNESRVELLGLASSLFSELSQRDVQQKTKALLDYQTGLLE